MSNQQSITTTTQGSDSADVQSAKGNLSEAQDAQTNIAEITEMVVDEVEGPAQNTEITGADAPITPISVLQSLHRPPMDDREGDWTAAGPGQSLMLHITGCDICEDYLRHYQEDQQDPQFKRAELQAREEFVSGIWESFQQYHLAAYEDARRGREDVPQEVIDGLPREFVHRSVFEDTQEDLQRIRRQRRELEGRLVRMEGRLATIEVERGKASRAAELAEDRLDQKGQELEVANHRIAILETDTDELKRSRIRVRELEEQLTRTRELAERSLRDRPMTSRTGDEPTQGSKAPGPNDRRTAGELGPSRWESSTSNRPPSSDSRGRTPARWARSPSRREPPSRGRYQSPDRRPTSPPRQYPTTRAQRPYRGGSRSAHPRARASPPYQRHGSPPPRAGPSLVPEGYVPPEITFVYPPRLLPTGVLDERDYWSDSVMREEEISEIRDKIRRRPKGKGKSKTAEEASSDDEMDASGLFRWPSGVTPPYTTRGLGQWESWYPHSAEAARWMIDLAREKPDYGFVRRRILNLLDQIDRRRDLECCPGLYVLRREGTSDRLRPSGTRPRESTRPMGTATRPEHTLPVPRPSARHQLDPSPEGSRSVSSSGKRPLESDSGTVPAKKPRGMPQPHIYDSVDSWIEWWSRNPKQVPDGIRRTPQGRLLRTDVEAALMGRQMGPARGSSGINPRHRWSDLMGKLFSITGFYRYLVTQLELPIQSIRPPRLLPFPYPVANAGVDEVAAWMGENGIQLHDAPILEDYYRRYRNLNEGREADDPTEFRTAPHSLMRLFNRGESLDQMRQARLERMAREREETVPTASTQLTDVHMTGASSPPANPQTGGAGSGAGPTPSDTNHN